MIEPSQYYKWQDKYFEGAKQERSNKNPINGKVQRPIYTFLGDSPTFLFPKNVLYSCIVAHKNLFSVLQYF